MVAVAHNNINLVGVLLTYGANPDLARPSDGTIPIMIAAYNGYSKIVGILIPITNLSKKIMTEIQHRILLKRELHK